MVVQTFQNNCTFISPQHNIELLQLTQTDGKNLYKLCFVHQMLHEHGSSKTCQITCASKNQLSFCNMIVLLRKTAQEERSTVGGVECN